MKHLIAKHPNVAFLTGLGFLMIPLALFHLMNLEGRFVNSIYLGLILSLVFFAKDADKDYKPILQACLWAGLFVVLLSVGRIAFTNLSLNRTWDFLCFFLDGHVAAAGKNFYIPTSYQEVFKTLEIPYTPFASFENEILKVGFKYPPMTMLFFLPLGYMDYETAHVAWGIFNLLILGLTVYVAWDMFFKDEKWMGLAKIAALIILFSSTRAILRFENTHISVLLTLLLAWREKDSPKAGIWLGLGVLIKPLVIIVLGYYLIKLKFKTLLVALGVILAISGVGFLIFGPEPYYTFFFDNPNLRVPDRQYLTEFNHSLAGMVAKWTHYDSSAGDVTPVFHPLHLTIGGLMGLMTLGLLLISPKGIQPLELGLIIISAVIVYPGSLQVYNVFLLPALLGLVATHKDSKNSGMKWLVMAMFVLPSFFFKEAFLWRMALYAILYALLLKEYLAIRKGNSPFAQRGKIAEAQVSQ